MGRWALMKLNVRYARHISLLRDNESDVRPLQRKRKKASFFLALYVRLLQLSTRDRVVCLSCFDAKPKFFFHFYFSQINDSSFGKALRTKQPITLEDIVNVSTLPPPQRDHLLRQGSTCNRVDVLWISCNQRPIFWIATIV